MDVAVGGVDGVRVNHDPTPSQQVWGERTLPEEYFTRSPKAYAMATRIPSLPSLNCSPLRSRRHGRMRQGARSGVSTTGAALHLGVTEVVVTVRARSNGQQNSR